MTTTVAPVRASLRFPAGVLIVAAYATFGHSVLSVAGSVLSLFSPGSLSFTFHLDQNESTQLPAGAIPNGLGHYSEAIASSASISFWAQFWVVLGAVLWAIVRFVLALCVLRFAIAAYQGDAFPTHLPALLLTSAIALGVGGSLANLFIGGGHDNAAAEIATLAWDSPLAYAKHPADLLWPILGALLLGLLAAVFRAGFQFKRDAEGLV
jgi:hypothetical protein